MSEDMSPEEYAEAQAAASAAEQAAKEAMPTWTPDQLYMLLEDESLREVVEHRYPELKPLASRLLALTRVDKTEAEVLKLTVDVVFGLVELEKQLKDDKYDYAELEALRYALRMKVNDALEGFKLSRLTEARRMVRVEAMQRKRRWLP